MFFRPWWVVKSRDRFQLTTDNKSCWVLPKSDVFKSTQSLFQYHHILFFLSLSTNNCAYSDKKCKKCRAVGQNILTFLVREGTMEYETNKLCVHLITMRVKSIVIHKVTLQIFEPCPSLLASRNLFAKHECSRL